jgi:antitoxin MazE
MKMVAKIIAIGNSRGIRLPKQVIEELALSDVVEIETRGQEVIIRSAKDVHDGWEASAIEMHRLGEDTLLLGEGAASTWDESDWNW